MPATPPIPEALTQLAQAVEQTAGLEVTCTRDCEVLSDELRPFDGRYPISVSTLRRFFNLIPKQGKLLQDHPEHAGEVCRSPVFSRMGSQDTTFL